MYYIRIDSCIYEVDLHTGGYLPMLSCGRREWLVAEDLEQADAATLAYWKDLPAKEIVALVGEERIVSMWASGTSLEDFVRDIPACDQWASYDGNESDIEPPTPDERVHVANGPRWIVTVTEPGGLSSAWEQTYESEDEAITAAEVWASVVEGREFDVSLHPDDDGLEELTAFVLGWDELVCELGYAPTTAYRHN